MNSHRVNGAGPSSSHYTSHTHDRMSQRRGREFVHSRQITGERYVEEALRYYHQAPEALHARKRLPPYATEDDL